MHATTDLYKQILKTRNHIKEIKAVVGEEEYFENEITFCRISGGLFSEPSLGNCASRTLELSFLPRTDVPRGAKIQIFVRLVSVLGTSEWIPKGIFYISRRAKDEKTKLLQITAFDAMLKGNEVWLNSTNEDFEFPMSPANAVKDIAARMGVELDERTVISELFPLDYPVDENGDLTMRDVLGFIAVSNAGNWIITDEGKLRLISFATVEESTNYLVTQFGEAITFGGVRILV